MARVRNGRSMVNAVSIDDHTFCWALETSAFLVPELPGRVARLDVPGIQGRITADSDPFANLVGAATLDEGNADETIRQVCEIFAGWNKEFGWLVSPLSTPWDLCSRLESASLVKSVEMAGMVCTDLGRPIAANPAVYVHEATADDVEAAIHTLADAMEIPADRAYAMTEALFFSPEPIMRRVYLAYVEGVDYPVATAGMLYMPDLPIALLLSSATLRDFRGYGIYTSLMARRLSDARQDGMEAAIIQAVRATSAPICRKLGFVEVMPMELYVGQAESEI